MLYSGSLYSKSLTGILGKISLSVLTVEKRSIKQPRPAKRGGQPRLKDGPVDVIPEEPCRTEVRTQMGKMIPHITHSLNPLLLDVHIVGRI